MVVEPGLCGSWPETPKTGFLTTRLKYQSISVKTQLPSASVAVWDNTITHCSLCIFSESLVLVVPGIENSKIVIEGWVTYLLRVLGQVGRSDFITKLIMTFC